MKARSKKAKGTKLEKEFADKLVAAGLDKYARRMVLSGAVKGFDGDVMTRLPLHIEAKNQETWSPLAYYRQAETSNPMPGRKINVVVMSRNRERIFCFLLADDLIELLGYAVIGGWGKA